MFKFLMRGKSMMKPKPPRRGSGREWMDNPSTLVDAEAGGSHTHWKAISEYYDLLKDKIKWPPNEGSVAGTEKEIVLQPGNLLDRYGGEGGTYLAPRGTPFEERSLPTTSLDAPYNQYTVKKPTEVTESEVAPWFTFEGGGKQYKTKKPVNELKRSGNLD